MTTSNHSPITINHLPVTINHLPVTINHLPSIDPFDKGARLIELTFGKYAIVDAEDYDRLRRYNWCALKGAQTFYAKTFHLSGAILSMHRLILNAPKGLFVDHIDHNGLNNRKSNLRLCTNQQNLRNKLPRPGCTSKYKGVSWSKARNKFRANIYLNRKAIHLGYFDSEIDAAKAYDKKARELFGEFAYLNFPFLLKPDLIYNVQFAEL